MDASKSCTFLALKYLLIVILVIDIINLIVAIPAAFSGEQSEDEKSASNRTKLMLTYGSNIILAIIALISVSRELFCLSLAAALLMLIETVFSILIISSSSSILTVVFNATVTAILLVYACLIRSVNRSRVEPAAAARAETK